MQGMADDEPIASLLMSGRRTEAFESLLAAYRDKVFRLCYSILGDRAQAEDAAQESSPDLEIDGARFRGDSALGTWVFRLLEISALRRSRNAPRIGQLRSKRRSAASPDPPDRNATSSDWSANAGQLPAGGDAGTHMEDRSYEEVARLLALPESTVKTYLRPGAQTTRYHGEGGGS